MWHGYVARTYGVVVIDNARLEAGGTELYKMRSREWFIVKTTA